MRVVQTRPCALRLVVLCPLSVSWGWNPTSTGPGRIALGLDALQRHSLAASATPVPEILMHVGMDIHVEVSGPVDHTEDAITAEHGGI